MSIIPGLYFMTQWLPSYLTQAWKVAYNQALGDRLVVISLCQDLGMWLGGAAVRGLAHRGHSLLGARRIVIVFSYLCMMSMLWLAHAPSINAAVAVLRLYVFGLGAWLANQQAFKQDITRGRVATVVGFVGFAETMLSAIMVEHVGKITQRTGAYGTVFIILASLFTFAEIMAMVFMRERWLPQSSDLRS